MTSADDPARGAEDAPRRHRSGSGIDIRDVYRPGDLEPGLEERLGEPGTYPYTRGIHASGYRGRSWTMRQYAGFTSPEETNHRFHDLLAGGQTGL